MRYFVKMPEPQMRVAAMESLNRDPFAARPYYSLNDDALLIADLSEREVEAATRNGAQVFADVRFSHFADLNPLQWRTPTAKYWEPEMAAVPAAVAAPAKGLNEVMEHIRAPDAWKRTRGKGVTIAIVDTGVCGTLKEIPLSKRSPLAIPTQDHRNHWQDGIGHGSMCAVIAAGSRDQGGKFNGVAPEATVLSARTTLYSSDIYSIYDHLVTWKRGGIIKDPLVVSNSYGMYTCKPSETLPEDHPYASIVLLGIQEGITVVFAAGNNHYDVLCNYDPALCSPNSIWGVNSLDQVISVGTVNENNVNQDESTPHVNSSRGPGQWARAYPKPDVVAPTYGEVVWGCNYQGMNWWGTSGACPQVAGLAALILSVDPKRNPQEVAEIIRSTATRLDNTAPTCVGHGLINCEAAVAAV
ncbi:MAG: S8 family serine peptidase [Deltaproteobacteria bacterium]|nr:S8 family serine peptidase [Deltaproteobacteria bacterium]